MSETTAGYDILEFMKKRGDPIDKIIAWILRRHQYDYRDKATKPDDPGWHACTCRFWAGYSFDFQDHQGQVIAENFRKLELI